MIDLYLKAATKADMDAALLASGLFEDFDGELRPIDATVLLDKESLSPPIDATVPLDEEGSSPPVSAEDGYFVNLRLIYADEAPEALAALQTLPVTPWRVWA